MIYEAFTIMTIILKKNISGQGEKLTRACDKTERFVQNVI